MLRFVVLTILCVAIISKYAQAENDTNNTTDVNTPSHTIEGISALPLKSIRYRRQHPTVKKIVKHLIRTTKRAKPRRRIKRPKIKYPAPGYSFAEPILSYKPAYPPLPDDVSLGVEESGGETIYPSFEHFNQLNLDSADFELPPCSYETQSMDLDFYSSPPHTQNYNHYAVDLPSFQEHTYNDIRKPHRKYGVPYKRRRQQESLEMFSSLEEDFPQPYVYKKTGRYYAKAPDANLHPPATNYGVPVRNCRPESQTHHKTYLSNTAAVVPAYHTPTINQNQYTLYDKKIRNSAYYAPDAVHKEPAPTDVQITYSPNYNIDLDKSHGSRYAGDFGEPPENIAYEHAPPPTTLETHQQPSESEDSRIYTQPTRELPLNPYRVRPSYDFPKTSYEVPIYDPVPFDDDRQELYPPISDRDADDLSLESTTRRPVRSRHRKRVSIRPPTTTAKQILEVPELEQTYEGELDDQYAFYSDDADANESSLVEQTHFTPTVPPIVHKQHWDPMRVRGVSNAIKHFLPTTIQTALERNSTTSTNTSTSTSTTKQQKNKRRPMQSRRGSSLSSLKLSKRWRNSNHTQSTLAEPLHPQSFYLGTVLPSTYAPNSSQDGSTTKRTTNSIFDTTIFKSPRNTYNSSYINNELRNIFKNTTSEQYMGVLPPNHKYF